MGWFCILLVVLSITACLQYTQGSKLYYLNIAAAADPKGRGRLPLGHAHNKILEVFVRILDWSPYRTECQWVYEVTPTNRQCTL
jgi:hypothetical protein